MIIDNTPGIEPLCYDEVRDKAPTAIAKLVHGGDDVRLLFGLVEGAIAGASKRSEDLSPAVHNLAYLLSNWDDHAKGDSAYWYAIIYACGTLHDATREHFDCLNLGHLEACLFAIRHAARNKS